VEKCTLRLDEVEQRLVFELLCKHGIKKLYKLAFEECEALQAVYSKDDVPNKLVGKQANPNIHSINACTHRMTNQSHTSSFLATPKKILDCINNFHTQLDEISLIVAKDSVKIKSYVDDAKGECAMSLLDLHLT
jgi:hypothetical protein